MNKKTLTLAIGMVLLTSLFSWVVLKEQSPNIPFVEVHRWLGESYSVKSVDVIQGHEYDLQLSDGRRIRAQLEVETTPEAREWVVRLLNESRNPRVILLERKTAGHWCVDLRVQPQNNGFGREVSVADWLRTKHLAYDD